MWWVKITINIISKLTSNLKWLVVAWLNKNFSQLCMISLPSYPVRYTKEEEGGSSITEVEW